MWYTMLNDVACGIPLEKCQIIKCMVSCQNALALTCQMTMQYTMSNDHVVPHQMIM